MNIFGRVTDILLAMICMFLLPFLMFRTGVEKAGLKAASEETKMFLDRVEKSNSITGDFISEMEGFTLAKECSLTFEIEVIREEYAPGIGEPLTARYTYNELLNILDQCGRIPLNKGDIVLVNLYRADPVTKNIYLHESMETRL